LKIYRTKTMQIKPATYLMTIRAILLNGAFKEGINFLSVQVNVLCQQFQLLLELLSSEVKRGLSKGYASIS